MPDILLPNESPDSKSALQSRTMIFNLLAPILSWGLALLGVPIPVEVQISILSLGNVLLRALTEKPITRLF